MSYLTDLTDDQWIRLRRIILDAYVQQRWPIKQALLLRQQNGLKSDRAVHARLLSARAIDIVPATSSAYIGPQ